MLVRFALATLVSALTCALPAATFARGEPAPGASPAVATSPAPARGLPPKDGGGRVHRAIVDCDLASFYNWPSRDAAPSPSSYPPARIGDAFDVIGDAHVSNDGLILYETTIDVVHPWGAGVHYWIASRCVNAA